MQHPYTCRKNNIILFWPPPLSLPPPLARSLILWRILLTRAHVSAYLYTHTRVLYIHKTICIHTYSFLHERTRSCAYVFVHVNIVLFACLHIYVYIWDVCVCEAALEETTDRSLVNSRFLPPSFAPFCTYTHSRQAINRPDRIYTPPHIYIKQYNITIYSSTINAFPSCNFEFHTFIRVQLYTPMIS